MVLAALMVTCSAYAQKNSSQQGRKKYEFMRNLPVYADSLIADLTYPLAWGNSDIKDFDLWKRVARQKVFDCMLTPPPSPADGYDVKVLYEEQRDGYRARKIEIRLSRYYTVPAYVLIPDGKGPFPAINALSGSPAEKPLKVIHNGRLVIRKNGMQYNVQGQVLHEMNKLKN